MDLRDITEFLKDSLQYVIFIIVIIFTFTFLVAFQPVAGNSMSPKLQEGDIVLVYKLFRNKINYKSNDIVVLVKNEKSYIKRIIGVPNQKIDYLNNRLRINNNPYNESFLKKDVYTHNFLFEDICSLKECPNQKIPENKYLVLGDNRNASEDSRSFGLVKKSEIQGKVLFRIWPINKLGKI